MSETARFTSLACLAVLLAGCGQTGKLYLPDSSVEVVTRPTQTPPAEPAEGSSPPNSPQTVDSPSHGDTPTPEVTAPESKPGDEDPKKKEAKEKDPSVPKKN